MRYAVGSLMLLAGCAPLGKIAGTTNTTEPLRKRVSNYVVKGDEFKIVEHERRGEEQVSTVAIQRRKLTRTELRALARYLAGQAKRPKVELLANTAAYAACIKTRERSDVPDPMSSEECERGVVLSVQASEPPVLYWGSAAPNY